MDEDQDTNRGSCQEANREARESYSEYLDILFDEGLKMGFTYKEMYEMDMYEITNGIEQRRKGMAYNIWKLASLTRHPWVKNFPDDPKKACPELYPKPKTIKMENWMMEKYMKGDRQ